MKLGCSSWSFHRSFEEGKIDQKKWIEKCADELGVDGIELLDFHFPSADDTEIKKIKRFIVDKGLTISCVSVSNNFGALDKKKRRKEVEKVKNWIEIAHKYGASILRVFAGWPGLAPWEINTPKPAGIDREKLWSEMVKCMKECA
jgi:sugar phosphate isomerase/epimerase